MYKIIRIINNEILFMRGLKKSSFTRIKNNRSGHSINTYWWKDDELSIHNFGDEASKDIICGIFGYELSWRPLWECDLIAIGSLLESAELNCGNNKIFVWGSGYIEDGEKCSKKNFSFCAVRGKATLDRVKSIAKTNQIPMGDPGLLINLVYPASKKDGKIGIVPHYVDLNNKIITTLKKDSRFKIISPLQSPKEVAEQISSCSMVLSSSLHGMIFADSYDIPNAHLSLSKKVIGGDYKFKDYCSGVGREYIAIHKKTLLDMDALNDALKEYRPIKNKSKIQRKLIKAFPYKELTLSR